jgi:hypothetical protein
MQQIAAHLAQRRVCYGHYLPTCADRNWVLGVRLVACLPPTQEGIEGNTDFFVFTARCAVNYWAEENGCKSQPDKPEMSGEPPGWGVPLQTWKNDCRLSPIIVVTR